MGHRRLHADAEDVEFEQAHLLDVDLVELTHRIPGGARLDGCAVQECRIGQQHAARMHRDVTREAVEGFDEGQEGVQFTALRHASDARGAQFGQVGQRRTSVTGTDVRERLGEAVDLTGRHAECAADIADRMSDAVGLRHGHGGDAFGTEAFEDQVVHLEPASGLDVDVDIGQHPPQRRQEALHQQAVPQWIDAADAEQVVDQAPRTRTTSRDPDAAGLHQVDDVGDGEEVAGEAEVSNRLELVVESCLRQAAFTRISIPGLHRHAATVLQRGVGLADRELRIGGHRPAEQHVEFGDEHLPQTEIGHRIKDTGFGQRIGAQRQLPEITTGSLRDLLGDLLHAFR